MDVDIRTFDELPITVDPLSQAELEFWSLILDASPLEIRHAASMVGTELAVVGRYVRMRQWQSGPLPH